MEKSVFTKNYQVVCRMLRSYRQDKGLTQFELATILKTPQSYISKCESGERRVDIVQLHAFCDALSVPLADFVAQYLKECPSRRSRR